MTSKKLTEKSRPKKKRKGKKGGDGSERQQARREKVLNRNAEWQELQIPQKL